jgi:hypothetical protein
MADLKGDEARGRLFGAGFLALIGAAGVYFLLKEK